MSHIKGEEVRGYQFKDELVCLDCVEKDELKEITEDEILTESEMDEDDYYFCDRCKEQL